MDPYFTREAMKEPGPQAEAGVQNKAASPGKTINLALQGGGAHGGFTWGVLDRLLEEKSLAFEGISATSAGAMNGAVGLAVGGREGAREALAAYWRRVSDAARLGPLQPSLLDRMQQDFSLSASPAFTILGFLTRIFSPYEFNPMNLNPLRDAVERSVDFDVLKRPDCPVKLFLSATNVRTGKIKVFEKDEISVLAVLASACIPTLFQAVEINGEAYWDGGYMGNPALFPLIYKCQSADVLIVHLNPLLRSNTAHRRRDFEPDQRAQLQLLADAGNARRECGLGLHRLPSRRGAAVRGRLDRAILFQAWRRVDGRYRPKLPSKLTPLRAENWLARRPIANKENFAAGFGPWSI
jgi:NTE family protein